MFAARVVEAVDVSEEGDFGVSAGLPVATPDDFGFERFEEAFDGGIVVAIALAAHRHPETVLSQQLLIVVGTILRPAIGVMNAALRRPSDRDGHVQRPQGKNLLHAVADGPANDAPGEKINDHGQIDPTFLRPDISDVARPLLVRRARREVLLQEIRRDVEGVIAFGRALELGCVSRVVEILLSRPPSGLICA